ncbi:MAG TPA: VWA domain-containing protein [Gemmatimonadota bacterium]|nr:VWA domain-containing protein [Gemmatimonadota bacterium]
MTGFLQPLALLALPLALLPFLLARRSARRGEPTPFSSLHLFEEAERRPRPRRGRSRRQILLRALAIALLVLAAARPTGPGRGGPASHRPTRAVVAVDVSASAGQREGGRVAWSSIRGWADSLLALAGPGDELALAAVADGIVGWWTGDPAALRRRLATLRPTARGSDWPRTLAALAERADDGTETYLLTDGSRGGAPPMPAGPDGPGRQDYRALRVWGSAGGPNRGLVGARWTAPDRVHVVGRSWGGDGAPQTAGRVIGSVLSERGLIPMDGAPGTAGWTVADSATFGLAGADALPSDDLLHLARGAAGAYPVVRLTAPDEPPESGPLFWEAAIGTADRGAVVSRATAVAGLAADSPMLALLPIRPYRADEARVLSGLAAGGTRLLFAPACPDPACIPAGAWLRTPGLEAPAVEWRLGPAGRRTSLAGAPGTPGPGVPEHLLARAPVRGALGVLGGPEPDWTWELVTGEPALWVRGPVAVWLVPLGPPVTRLGATPVFPLVVEAVLAAWDPRWRGDGAVRAGEPAPIPPEGAILTGPLGGSDPATWTIPPGGAPPRLERPGLYRVEAAGTTFLAVRGEPAEGDLTPVDASLWESSWGVRPTPAADWERAVFPRRRGPELWPWIVLLAIGALIAEAWTRRAGLNN